MKTFLSLLATLLFFNVQSQNKVLQLDGTNDFVNLGNTAANNIRTIEFWFKPTTNITSSLSTFKTMIGRNTGPLGAGDHFEFGIFFSRLQGNSGKIAFSINDDQSNNYIIYSNSSQWNSNQWYHFAAVLDSTSGTKMFIDGVLQNQTSNYTGSTDTSRFYTAIGRYGDFSRYFDGKIDDVKFHSSAIYSSNFTPTCNNSIVGDAGNWDFEGSQLGVADDISGNNNDGLMLNGASKVAELICQPSSQYQESVLVLDGIDDHVNLGSTAGDNVRTIEFWFKPATNITSSLSTFKTMIGRNTGPLGAGDHFEFGIFFSRLQSNSGKIAFSINDDQSNNYIIYSNSSQWNSNQWYHIAAVLDSTSGTKMFIDGILQSHTSNYLGSTDTSRFYTAIGRYGDFQSRYFDGKIDNVKFHSAAIYQSNFSPSCDNRIIGDLGTWNFNETSSLVAIDSSSASNNGTILNGAIKSMEIVCPTSVGMKDKQLNKEFILNIYPNPVQNTLNISIPTITQALPFQVTNMLGQTLKEGNLSQELSSINLENLQNGIYVLRVWNEGKVAGTYKIIKD